MKVGRVYPSDANFLLLRVPDAKAAARQITTPTVTNITGLFVVCIRASVRSWSMLLQMPCSHHASRNTIPHTDPERQRYERHGLGHRPWR